MRYEVYKIANVDSIKDVNLLNKFWSIILKLGIRLSGQEILLYTVDTRGEVNVFINPNPTNVRESILNPVGPRDLVVKTHEAENEWEILAPYYQEIFIDEYTRMIKCTDELSDDEINALSASDIMNDFAAIRRKKSVKRILHLEKVSDLVDEKMKERCKAYATSLRWDYTNDTLYLVTTDICQSIANIAQMESIDNID